MLPSFLVPMLCNLYIIRRDKCKCFRVFAKSCSVPAWPCFASKHFVRRGELKGSSTVWVSRTVDLRRLYDTRHNVTIVRFNDDDRGDWSRPTVTVVGIMHNLIRKQNAYYLFTFVTGDTILHLTLLPTGTCFYCCPIQLNRDVQFLLYTRRNPTYPNILDFNDATTLRKSNFNVKHPTIIYIHGYSDSSSGKGPLAIRNAYLRSGHYNVILINWPKLAVLPWYVTAVRNTRVIGPYLAHMVSWLDAQKAVSLSKIHVIGFSLGAEVAGFMGKALAPRKIGRITGLDPAYPLYMNTGDEGHLTWADAVFVDVIHTDGGNFGFPHPLGHVDFYPNGGVRRQPGCDLKSLVRMGFRRLINQYITCGHNRAWRYYAESVENPYGFPASRCLKWRPGILTNCVWKPEVYMGFAADPKYRGKFYLSTNSQSPFARNLTSHKHNK